MKNIAILTLIVFGIMLSSACKKEGEKIILDMNLTTASSITSPTDGTDIVITEENQDSTLQFTWTEATYNLTDLETIKYLLQMAKRKYRGWQKRINLR